MVLTQTIFGDILIESNVDSLKISVLNADWRDHKFSCSYWSQIVTQNLWNGKQSFNQSLGNYLSPYVLKKWVLRINTTSI